uniref:Uncharacterized protein n=1 Tax=Avena sativa TaxID=4498 RepID=A0ACD5YV59_AVESA
MRRQETDHSYLSPSFLTETTIDLVSSCCNMRVLRDRQNCACAAVQQVHGHTFPPMAQPSSLNVVKELLNDLELHLMILVSFGLQVFLLFTAGLRRRGAPHFLRSLIWLAYLLADSVAIFVLGHLAVKASGARHQLLLFWAPFVLLHLGGQHTITAFSMQDNKLWKRHLLEFFSHFGMACYIVSRSSWPDKNLQSAMVSMMIVGYFKYVERTMCLIISNPERLKFMSILVYYETLGHADSCDRGSASKQRPIDRHEMEARLNEMCKPAVGDMQLLPSSRFPWQMVLSSTPLNYPTTVKCMDALSVLLQEFKHKSEVLRQCASLGGNKKKNKDHLCPAYNYVGALLCAIYEHLYTKASFIQYFPGRLRLPHSSSMLLLLTSFVRITILLYPVFFIPIALVSFKDSMKNDHNQIYSLADVIVSYILLIGALILEATSIFAWLSSYTVLTQGIQCGCLTPLVSRVVRYIHSAAWLRRKQWSEMLGQHSRIKEYTRREGIMSFVPGCIARCLYSKTLTHKPLSEDLKKLVLNKLLDFGIAGQQYWNFASTRGKLALLWKRTDLAGPGTHLHKSINNVDFTTSLLIWHIATDICYYREDTSITSITKEKKKKMCQELSYYIMYLVIDCKVLLTSTADIIDTIACQELEDKLKNLPTGDPSFKQAIDIVFKDEQEERRPAADMASSSQPVYQGVKEAIESEILSSEANVEDGHPPTNPASNENQPLNHVERLRSTMDTINSPVLPRAREVAKELISIDKEVAWDLIADVWLEMLYYVAPRCGGEFHHDHLSTGGEFITHVLLLMHELGPFLPPPADLVY